MKRDIYSRLLDWKNREDRKPLVIEGARQIGKSWILEEFARNEYEDHILIDFKKDRTAKLIFQNGYDVEKILFSLQVKSGVKPKPGKTLIIFDEFQEAKGFFEVLKYFRQDAPEYHLAVAGSLLGLSIHSGASFPVGQCNLMKMYPMSFLEFLDAVGKADLRLLLQSKDWGMTSAFADDLTDLLRQYFFVGGMPEAVSKFAQTKDITEVRKIQEELVTGYENDFSNHALQEGVDPLKVRMVYDSVPSQLAKENKKFVYGMVKEGARAKTFEAAIQWLVGAGIVYKVTRVTKPEIPLSFYEDKDAFKLYFVDCGLLACMSGVPPQMMLSDNAPMVEFKGMFAEQYVYQQIRAVADIPVHYWSKENSTAEIEFIAQEDTVITPIEVKSGVNVRSTSLKNMLRENSGVKGVRFSMKGFDLQPDLSSVPLYAVAAWFSK